MTKFAMVVAWGPDYRFFYNDRYTPILGVKHPAALGKPGAEIVPEVWTMVGPEFDRAWRGDAFAIDDWLLPLERQGYLESCWFTLSYSPVRDESGGVGGVLAVVAETTGRVEGERRLATLRDLAQRASQAKASDEACRSAALVFEQNPIDVPFALLYLTEPDGGSARRVASVRLPGDHPAAPARVPLGAAGEESAGWPLGEVVAAGTMRVVDDLAHRFGPLPGGEWPEPTDTAVLYPLARPGVERPYGVLVAGVSPRRRLDDAYRGFFELAAEHLTTAVSNAHAFEAERRRAEALAEIDRAKTAFFSNVSHEFRTPLTLMLGPLEDALAEPAPGIDGDTLRAVHRNALRLLKLVNALLDFSRLEARRMEAAYEPTDLAAFTGELASGFRSAIERARLTLTVDLEPADEPALRHARRPRALPRGGLPRPSHQAARPRRAPGAAGPAAGGLRAGAPSSTRPALRGRSGIPGGDDRVTTRTNRPPSEEDPRVKIPDPQKQHRWLQQLVGSWEIDPAAAPEGQPETPSGTETVRKLGELWVLAEGAGAMPGGEPASSLMTLGYDPRTGRFVGSWIGSMMTHLWVYDGELDAAGRTLTLAADGPDMSDGDMSGAGKPLVPYRDAIELVSPDHRVLRSYSRGEDGGWQQFMELHYRRTGE